MFVNRALCFLGEGEEGALGPVAEGVLTMVTMLPVLLRVGALRGLIHLKPPPLPGRLMPRVSDEWPGGWGGGMFPNMCVASPLCSRMLCIRGPYALVAAACTLAL